MWHDRLRCAPKTIRFVFGMSVLYCGVGVAVYMLATADLDLRLRITLLAVCVPVLAFVRRQLYRLAACLSCSRLVTDLKRIEANPIHRWTGRVSFRNPTPCSANVDRVELARVRRLAGNRVTFHTFAWGQLHIAPGASESIDLPFHCARHPGDCTASYELLVVYQHIGNLYVSGHG